MSRGRPDAAHPQVPFREAVSVWLRVAAQSFGGPAGQIAVMHRILVEEKKWISEERFLHALNYCMLLPGPEAQQLATYIGWLLHGTRGGLVAGSLFVLPGFLAILLLSVIYVLYSDTTIIGAIFFGLKAAVLIIVLEALSRISRRALKNNVMYGIAAAAFVLIFFFQVPFPYIILLAGALGYSGSQTRPDLFKGGGGHGSAKTDDDESQYVITRETAPAVQPSAGRALRVTTLGLLIWFIPLLVVGLTLSWQSVFVDQMVFFSKMAVVTFGGAYAVLSYVAQQAVEVYGWLAPGEMLTGLGFAETTPGPLIQVVQFVGFLGAYREAAPLSPMGAAVLSSVLVTWVTYVPCFLWIFLGAPYIEKLRGNQRLSGALTAITAAVVGVILNLSVWFALHTLFGKVVERHMGLLRLEIPVWGTLSLPTLALSLVAWVLLFRLKKSTFFTLGMTCGLGILFTIVLGLKP
ncbi:chromate efflux transporter [Deinococcus cellulosilyticus]|uniref:Chromate transporter n=1 Tax=Deinococcus cellulosilyticus (strain DSM 18568 / NBRC 106333 / KACC 11606 / 5516J-15) TaxID=1223518 RepID=A0A511N1J8_DEIC1|nr:chromate efflux transporter [Deinococcus cellulosilyticus]GEM46216.1 chromate transporter [Deinococcus cellulosilyticus NBRC 106333 = KACC 11606]